MAEFDKNDLKKSTTSLLYYQQRSQSARPAPTRVPAGPPAKLIGGVHTHVYEERPAAPKADAGSSGDAAPASTGRVAWAAQTSASTVPPGLKSTKKIIFFTGREHQIVDAPDVPDFSWTPPHLKQSDVEPGPQLGVRETPGAVRVKLIGSKYRYLPTMEPYGTSMWAVSPGEAALYGSVGGGGTGALSSRPRPLTASSPYRSSLEAYAAQRIMGYKEYETASRMMNGVGSWERTQRHLTNSVDLGRPSTLRNPNHGFTGLKAAAQ